MSMLKGQYEISVWEDIIRYVGVDRNIYDSLEALAEAQTTVDYQFYSELRLAVIGSDTMTSLSRATNPNLTRNINGVYTLKFDMYYQFANEETGAIERNPLIDLVIDERKVKLYYPDGGDDQPDHWYDFIVKKDEEKGRDYKYSFTCNGLAANELGKTGFNIELDAELKNNMGTVQELGGAVLKDSDWLLANNGQQVIQLTNDEALYSVVLTSDITNAKLLDGTSVNTISAGARIYVYYTPYANQEENYFQFIYVLNDTGTLAPDLYEDDVTIYCNNTRTYDLYCSNVTWTDDRPSFASGAPSVSSYRGRRYVRKQLMAYDPVLEKTVYKYTKEVNDETKVFHGYTTTEYISAASITNYIHNSINFPNTTYWSILNGGSLEARVYPDAKASNLTEPRKSYLVTNFEAVTSYLYNDGIIHNYTKINNFEKGQKYRLKFKVSTLNEETLSYLTVSPFVCKIEKYELIDSPNNRTTYFTFFGNGTVSDDYIIIDAECANSATWRDLKENVGVFFSPASNSNLNIDYYIEEVQIIRYIEDAEGNPLDIDSVPEPLVNTVYHFYDPILNGAFISEEDYIYDSNDPDDYTPLYGSGDEEFEKVRSITAKESNRFNLLQQLAETFLCWVKFNIYHETDGTITVEDYNYYSPVTECPNLISNSYYNEAPWDEAIIDTEEYKGKKAIIVQARTLYQKTDRGATCIFPLMTFEENTQYTISLDWCDHIRTDGKSTSMRLFFKYTDGTSDKIISPTNSSTADWEHKIFTSAAGKTISAIITGYGNSGVVSITNFKIEKGTTEINYCYYDHLTNLYILTSDNLNNVQYFEVLTRKRQRKEVVFYGEILQDNYIGFKYGINLKDNNRTLDSDQIATKIIVKNNTCEQADNGFCSIARAKDNPIKENFALNLDYYTSQGLIDASTLNNDLYLKVNGSIGLYPRLAELNKERNNLITELALGANTIDNLKSQQQVYQLVYNDSTEELLKILDPKSGKLVQHTGYVYEDFGNQYKENGEIISAYPDTVYYIKAGTITGITGAATYYKRETATEPQDGRSYYKMSGNQFVPYTNTRFIAGFTYYYSVDATYDVGTYFQTGEETTSLTFSGSGTPEVYIYAAARRTMDVDDNDYINDTYTISLLALVNTLTAQNEEAFAEYTKYTENLVSAQAEFDSILDRLSDIAIATKEVEKEFYTKYSRYIQEGSWTDDNYMDDDLYYLDSLSVLYQSAYPKVTYNFTPLDLKYLEGYEDFDFLVAHKTYVEDVEMFGYKIIDGLRTPVREVVVVTELSQNLDDPTKNSIKIQNYKSHFEDLFQRITAATQSLEYHSGEYAKAAGAMTTDGEISQTTMQRSLANAAYVILNSRDQSVVWDETGLLATKLDDPLQITRLTSSGLIVSADGGQTWGVAISGYGINTAYLSAGTIDADKINILSGAYPTFKWDSDGLRAYGFTKNGNTVTSFDPSTFVCYDKYGIYGIKDALNPTFNTLNDIENRASFALTWNGLFMRAQHRDGYVRISPTEDLVIYLNIDNSDVLRAKFGLLNTVNNNEIYGLALYDSTGISTVETKSNGTLWLKSQMDIGIAGQTNTIYIGVGEEDTALNRYKVINVNDNNDNEKFVVYSDGTLKAEEAEISGTIHATSGDFTGIVHATSGDFTGTIYALHGTIGGNEIGEDGITIRDGKFLILDSNNNPILYTDNEGKLNLQGVYVSGDITALSGEIGGFTITEHTIQADGLVLQSTYIDENNLTIPSKIAVTNIDIGAGANITDYLLIGNLKLLNPNKNKDNNVLTLINEDTNYFTLDNFGNINGNNWSIKKEGNNDYVTARFGLLVAENGSFSGIVNATDGIFSGAIKASIISATTIETANFITEKVRSMGGAFIFKPTFEIIDEPEYISYDDQTELYKFKFKIDKIYTSYFSSLSTGSNLISVLGSDIRYGLFESFNETNNYCEILVNFYEGDYNLLINTNNNYNSITLLGEVNTNNTIIGINSDNSNTFLSPRALLMILPTSFNKSNVSNIGLIDYNNKLILGDLSVINNNLGYGLYSDNVYLHGSLVTETSNNPNDYTYAGVNTLPTTKSQHFIDEKIVFWAGASSYEAADNSPFYVTEKGNMYAKLGIFEGSVIANSIITHSTILAAIIEGTDTTETSPSLKIYDTDKNSGGIGFYKKTGDLLTLTINNTGFYHGNEEQPFISWNEANSNIIVNIYQLKTGNTSITDGIIKNGDAQLILDDTSKYAQLNYFNGNVKVTNGLVTITNSLNIINNNNLKLDYKVNSNGYYCLTVS